MAMSDPAPARKRRGRKPVSQPMDDGMVNVVVGSNNPLAPRMLPSGAMEIPHEDGSVILDLNPVLSKSKAKGKFDDNLALDMDDGELAAIGQTLAEGISQDDESRREWLDTRAKGLDLLGIRIEDSKGSTSFAPVEGMSVVRHPLLLEAVLRFQADARGELLPANGPVKVRDDGDETMVRDLLARALEKDMNHYLTVTDRTYYPDTDRMLFSVGFSGCAFKKVYHCPIRRRPVSESVDAKDLIVSNAATDLQNCSRVTHRIQMRQSVLKRMQILGVYRKVDLGQPMDAPNEVDRKQASTMGYRLPQRAEDQEYEMHECYCELDLPGYEHKDDKGEPTGLALPYRVTMEANSKTIVEIRRNWEEDDEDYRAKRTFVKYGFVDAFGFYSIGLLNILGNTTNALTAAWREMLDAGMFANFPGFLYSKSSGMARQHANQFRIAPGSGMGIETGGQPISSSIMPLPYKEAGVGLMNLVENIAQTGLRVGGAAQAAVAEGKQEAPVGTTLALIEQQGKVMSAVHKRLHAAQAEEFGLLRDRFKEDPSALWRSNKRAAKRWDEVKFVAALDQYDLVPCADPNMPSQMHRLMKAQALKQLAMQSPALYNMRLVDARVGMMADIGDIPSMFAPQQPPAGPDPTIMAELQLKNKDLDIKRQKIAADAMVRTKELEAKQNLGVMQIAERLATHPEANPIVNNELRELSPFLIPTQNPPQRTIP